MSVSDPSARELLGQGETLDRLTGAWRILQLRRGHRFSTDDVLTAWTALQARPDALRVLDLGSGVGSIGLMVLQELTPAARLVSIEVQEVSVALARRSASINGVEARVTQIHGDLRELRLLEGQPPFDLVLANPPYLSPDKAVASPHPQRAAARLELHGDVHDYCAVAARHLAPGGCFCLCHSARDPRPEQAIEQAGLTLLARRDVRFRHGQAPMITLLEAGWSGTRRDPPLLEVRGEDGRWTGPYRAVRRAMRIDP